MTSGTQRLSNQQQDWIWAGVLFALAFALRLLFLLTSADRDWPHSAYYEGDAPLWVEYAAAIDRHRPFEFDLPIHPPGVAHVLAWVYRGVHERGFVGAKVLWCALSAGTCAALYLCCVPLGRRVALLAASLCACSFGQYLLATSLNSETPYTVLLPAMVLMSRRLEHGGRLWWAAALGAVHGVATLFRPEHTLLVLMWGAWLVLKRKTLAPSGGPQVSSPSFQARLLAVVIMIVAMLSTCLPRSIHCHLAIRRFNDIEAIETQYQTAKAPWTADAIASFERLPAFARHDNFAFLNHLAEQRKLTAVTAATVDQFFAEQFGYRPEPLSSWVLVSNQGPSSFALANHPASDGGFSRAALEHPGLGRNPKLIFGFPPHLEVINDGYRLGIGYIRSNFGNWLHVVKRKFDRFFSGAALGFGAGNAPLGRSGVREPVDLLAPNPGSAPLWRWLMAVLIGVGVVLACRRSEASIWVVILAYKLLVTAIFYGYARQAVSIGPAFFVSIALSIDLVLRLLESRQPALQRWWRSVGLMLLAAMIVTDLIVANRHDAFSVVGPVNVHANWGPGAFQSFERLHISPEPPLLALPGSPSSRPAPPGP